MNLYVKQLIFALSLVSVSWVFPGAIITVTKTQIGPKKVIFFHDVHDEGGNVERTSSGTAYAIRDIAERQYRPFWHLFSQCLIKENSPSLMLVEWRPTGQKWRYRELRSQCNTNGYTQDELQKWFEEEDFFGRHYLWEYMCPKDPDYVDQLTENVRIVNIDERDSNFDGMLELFVKGEELYSRAQKCMESSQEQQFFLKNELDAFICEFNDSDIAKYSMKFGETWFDDFSNRIEKKFESVKHFFSINLVAQIKERIDFEKNEFLCLLAEYANTKCDMREVFVQMTKRLDWQESKKFQQLNYSFLRYTCLLVDLDILAQIFQAQEPLVMIYTGSHHADHILDWLAGSGYSSRSMSLMYDEFMQDEKLLEDELKKFVNEDFSLYGTISSSMTGESIDALNRSMALSPLSFVLKKSYQNSNTGFIHFAIEHNDLEMLKFLIEECKADTSYRDSQGSTPYDLALHYKNEQMVAYLEQINLDTTPSINRGELVC